MLSSFKSSVNKMKWLSDGDDVKIIEGRWIKNRISFIIYKTFVASFLLVHQILIWIEGANSKTYIFATQWGFFLITMSFLLDVILICITRKTPNFTTPKIPKFLTLTSLILTSVSYSWALLISLVFWIFLADFKQEIKSNTSQ